ncbi:MAG: TPM domain-containing protein [Pseudomonadales bacterium]|nr:TPM domain-containing protein [Pseudomonadales bacterium]
MSVENRFTEGQKIKIKNAIKMAELDTSGEIRVHIERRCKIDVLDRAAYIFKTLKMHRTKLRNGVLFYLAMDDKKFAILGDAGINKVVEEDFWENIKLEMLGYFKEGAFADGLCKGLMMAGKQLKSHFPYQDDDVNELDDEISFGDK